MTNANQETNAILEDDKVRNLSEALRLLNEALKLVNQNYSFGSKSTFSSNIFSAIAWVKSQRANRITEIVDEAMAQRD